MVSFATIDNHVKKPNPTDAHYVLRRVTERNVSKELFNGVAGRKLRSVEIYAVRIEHGFESSREKEEDYLSPLHPYVYAEDLCELRVHSHTIQMTAPLVAFQTQVTMVAHRFVANGGSIATNPKAMERSTDPGAAAVPGQAGGDVTIQCREFSGRFSVRTVGSPGQMLARKRTRDDNVPLLACSFNDPQKGVGALLQFPTWESVESLGSCMKPSMLEYLHYMVWPGVLRGHTAKEVPTWAGSVTYVRADFDPALRNGHLGLPEGRDYWEAGAPQGPWEDDGNGYGSPASGGHGGALRSNVQALLDATDFTGNGAMPSYAEPEPDQQPESAVHLYMRLERTPETLAHGNQRPVRVELKRKTPPKEPDGADPGKPGAKERLPVNTPTTTPEVLDLCVLYAKDLYLAGYIAEAREMLLSLDFSQMRDARSRSLAIEAGVLLERIDRKSDFYGNPLNWVPLLSVDTNLAVFKAEINRSLELLYFSHVLEANWNKLEEQAQIIESAQKQTRSLADDAENQIGAAWKKLGLLAGEMNDMEAMSKDLQQKLEELQKKLLRDAKGEVERKQAWEKVSSIFKIFSAVAACVPVGAPFNAMATQTLDMVGDLAGTVSDSSVKWNDNLVTAFDKSHAIIKTGLDDPSLVAKLRERLQAPGKEVDEAKAKVREIDEKLAKLADADLTEKDRLERERGTHQATVDAMESKGTDAVEKFNTQCEKLSKLFSTTNTEVKKLLVSRDETEKRVAEELGKLKEESAPFQALKKSLDDLSDKRARVAATMLTLETDIGKLAASLTSSVLNLDTLFREKGRTIELRNPRIRQLANRVRQQATEGLNKYQYYLKKSYEYNFLEPAQYDFGTAALQQQVITFLTKGDAKKELTKEQFQLLGTLYQETLGKLGEKIVDSLQGSYGRYKSEVSLHLRAEEVAALCRDGQITLDLDTRLPAKSEDVRIRDVAVEKIILQPGAKPDNVQVRLWHSGTSTVRRGGKDYQFVSSAQRMWGVDYDPDTRILTAIDPADKVDGELVRRLFNTSSSPKDTVETLGRYNPAFSGLMRVELLADGGVIGGLITDLNLKFKLEFRAVS